MRARPENRLAKWAATCLIVVTVMVGSACTVLPPRPAMVPEHAIRDGSSTPLGETASRSIPAGYVSGFFSMPVASAAFETRLALADLATKSIDLQTFVFMPDKSGAYLLKAMHAAAVRGVRIRLLVDDLLTSEAEPLLRAFADVPNVQVRLFNPFVLGRSSTAARLVQSLHELGRVNHRMHNKLFVADNSFAIVGGRNTADEYFMRSARANFIDYEVLAGGRVVQELSETFDEYWNSRYAYPIHAVVSGPAVSGTTFDESVRYAAPPPTDTSVPDRLQRYTGAASGLHRGRVLLVGARAQVKADPVDKVTGNRLVDRKGTVREFVGDSIRSASTEAFIISPYLVPGPLGMEAMRRLRGRGVAVTVLTNSLAATDEPIVHGAYLRYREEMLRLGVRVFELSPTLARSAGRLGRFGDSDAALHAKVGVIDRKGLLVGSMNLDGRSSGYNTELGVLIESAEFAEDFLTFAPFDSSSYEVRLSAGTNAVEWHARAGDAQVVLDSEPESSLWLRFKIRVLRLLIPEGWL